MLFLGRDLGTRGSSGLPNWYNVIGKQLVYIEGKNTVVAGHFRTIIKMMFHFLRQ